jgi:hypothetical protein
MADKKISALTSASLPLAGTEVLPIVQSSATVKVAVDDLTVKNIRSNASTGLLQITGLAAASTRVATVPDANWTAARTDAAQTFTGNQLFNNQLNVGGANIGTLASVTNTSGWGIGSKVGYGGWWPHYVWSADTGIDNFFIRFDTETSATQRGSITYNRGAGLVAYNITSDYRAKDILGPVINSGTTIDALKVYSGMMKGATQARPMLIAHEAQEITPYAVTGEKDAVDPDTGAPAFQQMDHSSYVPLLIAEIQALRARVAALEGNK